MKQLSKFMLRVCLVVSCLCNGAMAAYLDFTDSSTIGDLSGITDGFAGTVDGVGFTLTSTNGAVNFNEGYDGSLTTGCQSGGPLKCDRDGAGIRNDEITAGQTLSLIFDTAVYITSFDFLDLYIGNGVEQAIVSIDGTTLAPVIATGSSGDGGYANLNLLSLGGPILGSEIEFTASFGSDFKDDRTNDYAFAGASVSAVPIPAAVWLFGTALIGLFGFSKRRKAA